MTTDPPETDESGLPEHFRAPVRHCPELHSKELFPRSVGQILAGLSVSPDEAHRWHERGLLSFDPILCTDELVHYGHGKDFELEFVRDVMRSGLTDAQIDEQLRLLGKPYAVDPDAIAWSFRYGWVEGVGASDPHEVIEDYLDWHLAALGAGGELDALESIRDKIDALLVKARTGQKETPE